jgi:DNA-directed RNA polymerase III subunit RPC8
LKDKIKVVPKDLADDMMQPVIDEIHRLYANKVIAQVGLCVHVHQILEMGDMYIYPNEGAAYIVTIFNMIMFRPFTDEVLVGTICKVDETGLKVSLGFFDEVLVPANLLPSPSTYDAGPEAAAAAADDDDEGGGGVKRAEAAENGAGMAEGSDESQRKWVWSFEGEAMDMMVGDEVRFRTLSVSYHEARKDQVLKVQYDSEGRPYKPPVPYTPPMSVLADVSAQGLGRTEWWDEAGDDDDDDEGDGL